MRRLLFSISAPWRSSASWHARLCRGPRRERVGDHHRGKGLQPVHRRVLRQPRHSRHVIKENASPEPIVHNNLHLEATGESSGDAYVYNTTINSPVHVAADGSYTRTKLVNFVLVSKGNSPNMRITFRLHQVFASDGTLISETSDFSLDCRGSRREC